MVSATNVEPGRDDRGMDILRKARLVQATACGGGDEGFLSSNLAFGLLPNMASTIPLYDPSAGLMAMEGPLMQHLRQLQQLSGPYPGVQQAMAPECAQGLLRGSVSHTGIPRVGRLEGGAFTPYSESSATVRGSAPHSAAWTLQKTPSGLVVVPIVSNQAG
jgi:hypothetical protein